MRAECPVKDDTAYNRLTGKARAILVDSEPKVIKQILASKLEKFEHTIFSENGRGNNWALGFSKDYKENHKKDEVTLHERAIDALRKEAEKADFYLGTVLTHSLAGGTGSGLGSRLIQEFRDEFPKAYLMTVSIFPS